jgi:alkylhydroperoxidase family enzyme
MAIAGAVRSRATPLFDERQRSVLACAMTRKVQVLDEIFAEVQRFMNDRIMVELTATTGAYNMRARFLVALEITLSAETVGARAES